MLDAEQRVKENKRDISETKEWYNKTRSDSASIGRLSSTSPQPGAGGTGSTYIEVINVVRDSEQEFKESVWVSVKFGGINTIVLYSVYISVHQVTKITIRT